jgi:twitching motility protein PilJ
MAPRTEPQRAGGRLRQRGFFDRREDKQQGMSSTHFGAATQKSGRLYAMVGLLVILLAFVAATFFLLTRDSRNEQEWIRLATDLQVHSQQMSKSAREAVEGNRGAFVQLDESAAIVADAVLALKKGDPVRELPVLPSAMRPTLADLDKTWARMNTNAQSILERENLVMDLASASNALIEIMPEIQELTDRAIRDLTRSGASAQQVFVAGRQLALSDRILRHLAEMLRGGPGAVAAADNFTREIEAFRQTSAALLQGSRGEGVAQVGIPSARDALNRASQIFENAGPQLATILASTSDILAVRGAADELFVDSLTMFLLSRKVADDVLARSDLRIWPSLWSGSLALVVIVVAIALMVRSFLGSERRRAVVAGMQNQKNQQAIMRLLDEMSSLADGDLRVRATVTDDMTGAIADSVNYAVEQLRGRQAEQVRGATDTINEMARSFEGMARRSNESSEVARRSVAIAHNGSQMVQQTIRGMDTIRDQIQETSKRIKRLGESSQEIGDIVELINGIAEQTNILALNAAIQSASAGGAGRGFAVVADEVQRLAERATNATRRIELLVQNIQADTSEAVVSMESTTSEVVAGAEKAEDAGEALKRIESVSKDLSSMIEEISQEAQAQSEVAMQIADQMNSIRDVSIQTSEGSNQTAQSMGRLADLVHKLSDSVADFKLPQSEGSGRDA